jgi:general secretion pathway protein C
MKHPFRKHIWVIGLLTIATGATGAFLVARASARAGEAQGVRKTGERSYEIERATFESALSNLNVVSRTARIVPEIRNGKAVGFRLYSVRPDGALGRVGLQNGDVISSVNGRDLTTVASSVEIYGELKSADHLSVGLERGGRKMTIEYGII